MTWRYRVVREDGFDDGLWYSIHEVYTSPDGRSWTQDDCSPRGENLEDLKADLAMMADALSLPVMEKINGSLVEVQDGERDKRKKPSRKADAATVLNALSSPPAEAIEALDRLTEGDYS